MGETEKRRRTPEQFLTQVEAEERHLRHGKLKIFLGYASGVGKSFRMFDEGRRRKLRGQDIVVAAAQPEVSKGVDELLAGLEVIAPQLIGGEPCIDVEAVVRRHPGVCLIDGLAYTNPAGSRNEQRWQDVDELLAAGIGVITTINLQFVAEKQQQVEKIRGKRVTDSVPESFIRRADEIEIVDAPAEYCASHTSDANPVSKDQAARVEQQLSELREIALVLAADVVDQQLEEHLRRQGIEQTFGANERILICLTARSNASLMISRGKRQADRFHGELFVAYVENGELNSDDRLTLEQNLESARKAQAHVEVLHGEDPVSSILRFAEGNGITQIFAGHSGRSGWLDRLRPNPVERLIMESEGVDIRIFPQEPSHRTG